MSEQQDAPARPLYERIEGIRVREGWTKTQMARHLRMNRGTIENWKTQPRSPLASTVKDIATRLGIDHDEALRLAGVVPQSASAIIETAGTIGLSRSYPIGTAEERDEAGSGQGTVGVIDFGLSDDPPFPNPEGPSQDVINRMWFDAKALEAAIRQRQTPVTEREVRALRAHALSIQTIRDDIGRAAS